MPLSGFFFLLAALLDGVLLGLSLVALFIGLDALGMAVDAVEVVDAVDVVVAFEEADDLVLGLGVAFEVVSGLVFGALLDVLSAAIRVSVPDAALEAVFA